MTTQYQNETQPQAVVEDDEFADYIDTYAFGGTEVFRLKDGKQTITFQIMNEGQKAKYQRLTNRDIRVDRKTDQASFRPDQAADRHALILTAVVGWNLWTRNPNTRKWEPLSFSQTMLQNWLQTTDPLLVEELEKAIRKANPWLIAEDATEEDIEKEIAELQDQLIQIRARDAGKDK